MYKICTAGFLFCVIFVLFAGCFALPLEDTVPPPPVSPLPQARMLRTTTVTRGDVIRSVNSSALYVPAREERLFFSVADLRVSGVYAEVGDNVQAGDLIATAKKFNTDITKCYNEAWKE